MIDLSSLIERIEAKCRGSGEIHVCCHPDVDDLPAALRIRDHCVGLRNFHHLLA